MPQNPLLAARAFESMLWFEKGRQQREGITPLAAYVARLLARKSAELYNAIENSRGDGRLREIYERYDGIVRGLPLSGTQRRRLVNDSHALAMDGLDRHRLWAGEAKKVKRIHARG